MLVSAALTAGCSKDPATQVIVILHAEPALLAQAKSVHVKVRDDDGATVLERTKDVVTGESSLAHVPLVPKGDNPSRRFTLTAALVDAAGSEVAHVEARSGYVANELGQIDLWFDDACSKTPDCGEGRTCQGGTCVGACFTASALSATTRSRAMCGECETCGASCVPVSTAIDCGCPGETCKAGSCTVKDSVRHIAAGAEHTCASLDSRDVYCWGNNQFEDGSVGQLGNGDAGPAIVPSPTKVEGADGWRSVSAGVHHTCTENEGFERFCWGNNIKGEIAAPANIEIQRTPRRSSEVVDLDSVVCGANHSCGIRADATDLYCWGNNGNGTVGINQNGGKVYDPKLVGSGYKSVAASGEHTCALRKDRSIQCWGHNDSDEVGALVGTSANAPVDAGCDKSNTGKGCFTDYIGLGLGWFHSCAIREGGKLYCWGGNINGQLGFKPSTNDFNQPEPTLIAKEIVWSDVAGGRSHTCAQDNHGALYCWGLNADNQLGFDSDGIVTTPTKVDFPLASSSSPSGFLELALGEYYSCALRTDHTLWCWGKNHVGQIGIGTGAGTALETPVRRPKRVCFSPRTAPQ